MHFPISVSSGGIVRMTVDQITWNNAVMAGMFLGGAGHPTDPDADRRLMNQASRAIGSGLRR